MSIDKQDGIFALICDVCGDYLYFDDFNDAVDYKKGCGWHSHKRNGEWEDVCPDCMKGQP